MNKLVCDRCGHTDEVDAGRMRPPGLSNDERYLVPEPWLEVRYNHNNHDVMARRSTTDTVTLYCGTCAQDYTEFNDGAQVVSE